MINTTAARTTELAGLTNNPFVAWNNLAKGKTYGGTTNLPDGAAANAFAFQNARAGGTYVLIVKQDSNGSRTVTWPSAVRWSSGIAPTLTTTASRADVAYFTYDGTVFYGSVAQNYVAS